MHWRQSQCWHGRTRGASDTSWQTAQIKFISSPGLTKDEASSLIAIAQPTDALGCLWCKCGSAYPREVAWATGTKTRRYTEKESCALPRHDEWFHTSSYRLVMACDLFKNTSARNAGQRVTLNYYGIHNVTCAVSSQFPPRAARAVMKDAFASSISRSS